MAKRPGGQRDLRDFIFKNTKNNISGKSRVSNLSHYSLLQSPKVESMDISSNNNLVWSYTFFSRVSQLVRLKTVDEMIPPAPEELKPLLQAVNTLVISTAECERGFSQMNILTTTRSSLEVKSMSALLFIKCVGPPLNKFRPEVYVKTWLQSHCLANNPKARARKIETKKHDYENLWKLL